MTRQLWAAAAVVAALAGCGGDGVETEPDAAARAAAPQARAAFETTAPATATATATATAGTFAHDKHADLGLACEACHACAGTYTFSPVTLPDGTSTVGGSMTNTPGTPGEAPGATTCAVSCHGEPGVPLGTAVWSHGPMACTGCHQRVGGEVRGARSTHVRDADDPVLGKQGCQSCHLLDAHHSGLVRLVSGDGVPMTSTGDVDAFCKSCHDASGHAIAGNAPSVLLGFEAGGADVHGASGDSSALSCTSCHAAHGSTNAFLFASVVNGIALPANAIDRAGIGGDALCFACHPQSPRHAASGCMVQCHSHEGRLVGHGTTPPVPPSGACFYCHGHEGVEHFLPPKGCRHCHGSTGWRPSSHPAESRPPLLSAVSASPGTASASLQWTTDERADSWVSYSAGGTTLTTGSGTDVVQHAVSLAGLQTGVLYDVEVRSADAFHNVGAVRLLLTAGGPGVPVLVPRASLETPAATAVVTLRWNAVTSPNGAVSYEIEVAASPSFAATVIVVSATGTTATVSLANHATYWWRVTARDSSGRVSRSIVGTFQITDNAL